MEYIRYNCGNCEHREGDYNERMSIDIQKIVDANYIIMINACCAKIYNCVNNVKSSFRKYSNSLLIFNDMTCRKTITIYNDSYVKQNGHFLLNSTGINDITDITHGIKSMTISELTNIIKKGAIVEDTMTTPKTLLELMNFLPSKNLTLSKLHDSFPSAHSWNDIYIVDENPCIKHAI